MNTNNKYYQKYIKYKQKYIKNKQIGGDKSLYDRLGGIYNIAAVVDRFSDAIIENAIVGKLSKNEDLKKWSNDQPERLAGLKFMRTLWVCEATGGPFKFEPTIPGACHMSLENAHGKFQITPDEFDVVAKLLKESLEYYKVPQKEMKEVMDAFNSHKIDVTKGYYEKIGQPIDINKICPKKNN